MSYKGIIAILATIANFLVPCCYSVNRHCDYYQYIKLNQQFIIHNAEYPRYYGSKVNCRWIAEGPPGTQIQLNCKDVRIPESRECAYDHLAIDQSGDTSLKDPPTYCGSGSLYITSDDNVFTVGSRSARFTRGGRFYCTLTAIESTKPPLCDCGYRQERRIVGGVETEVNEFPYMSGIADLDNRHIRCGSTIISDRYALSAAHCFVGKKIYELALLVGDHNYVENMETNYAALYNIKQIITNDQYDAHLTLYDVSLVKTTKQIIFNIAVGPVCLPFRYSQNDFAGQLVTILGWGTTEFSGPVSEHLRKTNVTVYSNSECQPQISSKLLSNQLCTSSIKTDSCQYDSGGPVIFADSLTRRDFLIGSISSGRGCAGGIPSINSRITSFLQWIVDVTPGKYKDCYALSDTCHYLATCIKI